MKDKKNFGLFIQGKRREKGLTQLEFADLLFVTESAVSKWERGQTYPDITLITDICRVLEISEHEFINASNDNEYRKVKSEAKKFRAISMVYFLIPTISYLIAILTCFIVNLAVNHCLSWFFIVLTSVLFAFTLVPGLKRFVKQDLLLINSLASLGTLILMLFVLACISSFDWFFVTVIALLFVFVCVFGPILFHKYDWFGVTKKYNYILSLTTAMIFLDLMILVISVVYGGSYSLLVALSVLLVYIIMVGKPILKLFKSKFLQENAMLVCFLTDYVVSFFLLGSVVLITYEFEFVKSFLLLTIYFIIFLGCYSVIKYLKAKKEYKASILSMIIGFTCFFSDFIIGLVFGISVSYHADLINWNSSTFDGNFNVLILIATVILTVTFLIMGNYKDRKELK